ncbi:MAG: HDIG domain-containing protein [Candidatus Omnitrophica bacterium]|nr:HDIG domain-containing protein [Candidatus Omnitrophota bacterium]
MKKYPHLDKLISSPSQFKFPFFAYRWFVVLLFSLVLVFVVWLLQVNFVIVLFLLCLLWYFSFLQRTISSEVKLLHVLFLFILVVVPSYFILSKGLAIYFIPFSFASMLATLLFSDRILSFILTTATAFVVSHFSPNGQTTEALFLVSGLVSAILVYDARRRNTIINAGIFIGILQAITYLLASNSIYRFNPELVSVVLGLLINGFVSAIIVLGCLSIFEHLFKTVTNIHLLELADFNNPVLNRLMLEAPGTYHHSLVVGNLSEAAAKAVGANALLARIGAYYHDIGKLTKPEYFNENMGLTQNIHDTLAPNMSRLVIMNHVNEGVELAKRHKLNPRLIDFIQQHHGKSLVYYFYRRAIENGHQIEEISEEGFRYPGPKPSSKETAIVLLADSVEAASRALKNPTPAQLEETVHKIINNKFIDGQLDECPLTLKDLEIIATVFSHILSGMYHHRLDYPEEKSDNHHTKPTGTNLRSKDKG